MDYTVFLLSSEGEIAGWNAQAEAMTGYPSEGILGRPLSALYADEAEARNQSLQVLRTASQAGICRSEQRCRCRDGRLVHVRMTVTAQFDGERRLAGFSVLLHADSEAERNLRSERQFTDTMIESMPGILYFYDMQGRFLRWNRNFMAVSGYATEEIARMHPLDFFKESDKARLQARIAEVFDKGESSVVAEFLSKDGTTAPYYFTGRRVLFDGLPCLVGVGIDISEQVRAESKLAESEHKYRDLVENANSIILRWNSEGVITLLNEFGLRFFGYAADEIIGRHVVGTIVPFTETSGRDLRGLMQQICADPKAYEQNINENMRRSGERVWIAWTNRIALDAQGQVKEILSIGTDITARKQAEEARQESEARYRKLFEYAPDGILIADSESHYLDANASVCRMLGYPREELIGMHASDIVDPAEIPNIEPALNAIKSAFDYHREWRFRRKDNTVFAAEVTVTLMPDGHLMAMIRDISERKRAEAEQEKRQRAEAADRIKSAFLATMSHELRTPLNSIIGFTGILLQKLAGPLNPEQSKQLDMVRVSARHLLALVNDVLDISKLEAGQLEIARLPFDPQRSIAKVLSLVTPQAEAKNLDLQARITPSLGEAIGDERRFEQILLNLIGNAIKFTDQGNVTVTAQRRSDAPLRGSENPSPTLRIQVIDSGMGIRPEDLPALFQPFRQVDSGLSRQHEGTGLGLAICRRLTEMMGGEIHAASEWGKGSTFTVILPLKGQALS